MWTVGRPGDILYIGNTPTMGIDTSTAEGFQVWKNEAQRRKAEAIRKYATSTNEDYVKKLRHVEEWWDEPEGTGRNPLG